MLLQIEDAALLWMYTSDLLKVWIELYTLYLLFLVKYGVKGATLQVYFLSMFSVFAEVAQVNAEALNIKSYQPRQKHCRGSAEAKFIFIWLPQHFICCGKKYWNSRAETPSG